MSNLQTHRVRVHPSKDNLPKDEQLAWKIAAVATDNATIDPDSQEMVINRLIDNAAVAIASVKRRPVANARSQALAHPHANGATLFGCPTHQRVCAEWAAWANGTAVRELDFHDTFLAADYSHPGDNIPPILAVAQQMGSNGEQLLRGILTGYEIHINLVKAICLHKHKIDHMAHLCPASTAGIGTLLGLDSDTVYQAVQQAVHTSFTTRQSRKGEISSWKAYVPGYSAKLAVEAVDRAMRGEKSPSPIYEGEDSVIAWMLDGPDAEYQVPLPAVGAPKRAILDSYTKEHSAEYQAQAIIDLAFKMGQQIDNYAYPDKSRTTSQKDEMGQNLSGEIYDAIDEVIIHTSHHTHYVIGTGSGDPQKQDPTASRETLDHSITYIFAVALQDGTWHHVDSYTPERAGRADTVQLWHKIRTQEDPAWTERYHSTDPDEKAFGARVEIRFADGTVLEDELAVANAHTLGAKPFGRAEYIHKFDTLTNELITPAERDRFLELVQCLPTLTADEVLTLNVAVTDLVHAERDNRGIF